MATVEYEMLALFYTNPKDGCCSKCCEFRQDVRGKFLRDGKRIIKFPGHKRELVLHPKIYSKDGYDRDTGWNSDVYTDEKFIDIDNPDFSFESYKGYDSPGAHGKFNSVSFYVSFWGYIVDNCRGSDKNVTKVGETLRYGFKAEGKWPNVKIELWGKFDNINDAEFKPYKVKE